MGSFRPKDVADIMSRKLVTLFEGDSLGIIEQGMSHYRFRHLPVIDQQGRLVGLVTQRDLLLATPSPLEERPDARKLDLWKRFRVADIMTRGVLAVAPDLPLRDAASIMRDKKLGCLPVTNAEGLLVGLVTEADFVKLAVELLDRWA